MQSIVSSALKSSAPAGGSRRGGGCGCGGTMPEEHENAPTKQHKRGGSGSDAPLPAHHLTAPHIPPAKASKPFTYALSAKRLVLSRVRLGTQVRLTPNSGTPDSVDAAREEQELSTALDVAMFAHETKGPDGKISLDIDLAQFKSVSIPALPPSASSKPPRAFKLYLTVHPHHTYKLQFSSAREREVWREILQSYGEYHLIPSALKKEEQKSNGHANGSSSHDGYPAQPISPRSLAVANAITQALGAYNAYTIAPLYVRTLLSFFDALQSGRAFEKEGLFRTGRSNPALLKQVLLNGGTLSGLEDQAAHMDGHTMAFNVKSLLRCLPESLFTAAKSDAIFEAAATDDAALLVRLMNHLPPANILLLQRLFELMYLTLSSPSSRMTTDSLTKVVGPNLLARDDVASIRAMTGSGVATFQDETGKVHVSRGAAAAEAASASASASARPVYPAPGSIPMLKLFTLLFELGSKIWPGSAIFASEAGLHSALHPAQQEYGHVRVHAGESDDASAAAPDQKQLALARGLSPVAEEHQSTFSPTPASAVSQTSVLSPPQQQQQQQQRNGTASSAHPMTPTAVSFDSTGHSGGGGGARSGPASSSATASSASAPSSVEMSAVQLPGSTMPLPAIAAATRLPVHREAMHHRPEDLVYEQEEDVAVEDAEQIEFPTFHFEEEE